MERRDDGDTALGYAAWPPGAKFRASVNPKEYELATPEQFYTQVEFLQFVRAIANAYANHYPDRVATLEPVTTFLRKAGMPL